MKSICMCVFLVLAVARVAYPQNSDAQYRYIVSWDYWNDDVNPPWESVAVRLNGKMIGNTLNAFKVLDRLPVEKGEHVKMELPSRQARSQGDRQLFFISDFIYRWTEKGAEIDLYQDNRKLDLHVLTWTKFFGKDGNYVPTLDDVVWVVDGVEIGNGDELKKVLRKWVEQGGVSILKLTPLRYKNPSTSPPGRGLVNELMDTYAEAGQLRIFSVQPLTEVDAYILNTQPK